MAVETEIIISNIALDNRLAVVEDGLGVRETNSGTFGIVACDHLLVHVDEQFALAVFDATVAKIASVGMVHEN